MSQERMHYDVVIVGAGPAGLSAAIKLKQLANEQQQELSVCVLEKASAIGNHTLSGAVLEPRALDELLPNWRELDAPITRTVTDDQFFYLTKSKAFRLPTPKPMHNQGNYIISLAKFCRFLGEQATQLGVEIYPGFSAHEILFDDANKVIGITTGAMGLDQNGQPSDNYQPSMAIEAKQTLFAEGCHGHLSKQLIQHYQLRDKNSPQTYALGIKELWRVDSKLYQPGRVTHTIGWPLDNATYGGSFIYHLDDNKVALGFVVGLDYQNPYLSPFEELQRFKHHPFIKELFVGGERIGYGARALIEGGLQALPKLTFQGGALIGDCAGFLNVPKIKGTHTAMKSALLAAEAVFQAIQNNDESQMALYPENFKASWAYKELYKVRNIRPSFKYGLWAGLAYSAIDTYLFRGHAPWTFKHHSDYQQLALAKDSQKINYPKPDNQISFDRLSSVYLSNTHHREDQPCHLQLQQANLAINSNLAKYDSPESRYCPAAVYEIVYTDNEEARLQINAANCVHCKTCDIKDPNQNINWVTPEGGGGPNYTEM